MEPQEPPLNLPLKRITSVQTSCKTSMIARINGSMGVSWVSIARTAMLILGKYVAYKCTKKVLE